MKYQEAQKHLAEKVFCEECGRVMELQVIQAVLAPEETDNVDIVAECSACDVTLYLEGGEN
jgi:hypothetical protein